MPQVANVAALEDHGGTGLRRKTPARTSARLASTLDPPIQLANHRREASEGPVEGGELLA